MGLKTEYDNETTFLGNKTKEKQATFPISSNRFCKRLQCSPKCSWSKWGHCAWEEFRERIISNSKSKWRCWKLLVCSWLLCSLFTQVTQPAGQQILQTKLEHLLCTIPQGKRKGKKKMKCSTSHLLRVRQCPSAADGVWRTAKAGSFALFQITAY